MTRWKRTILKGLLLLCPTFLALLLLGGYWWSKGKQANEAEREAPVHSAISIEVRNGVTTLTVDEASQTQSGIRTKELGDAVTANGPTVYGTVIDLQPLVELSSRYASTLAELNAARLESATSQAELARVKSLYEDDRNVSLKALGAARVADAASAAKVNVVQMTANTIAGSIRQQFGTKFAVWATSGGSSELAPFAARREVVVRIALISKSGPAPTTLTLYGNAQSPIQAQLVSASPQTDPNIQGQTYVYWVAAPLAVGTRVVGHLGENENSGLDIPAPAVVWYGGQPWVYVRTAATTFERRTVDQSMPRNGDYLVTNGFKSGEQVVISGAQLLLSEESRALLSKD
jgi:hypothetical protein